jgi:hypothetical protein
MIPILDSRFRGNERELLIGLDVFLTRRRITRAIAGRGLTTLSGRGDKRFARSQRRRPWPVEILRSRRLDDECAATTGVIAA